MAKTRTQKEKELKTMTESLQKAKAVVLVDYQQAGGSATQQAGGSATLQAGTSGSKGMTTKQLSDLRDSLREQNAQLVITKNTLLKKALDNEQLTINDEQLFHGPTATLFAYDDEISPIKALVKAFKDSGIGKIKAGFLGVEPLSEARIQQLATLPSKDELRGKTVGVLVAPLQGMIGVLQGNLRNLTYALNQIRLQKGGV